MNYKVEAWSWCADYCKKNQWNPHDSYFWNKANLEYRRQHNIFEAGDFFVFLNGDNPEIMEVQHVWDEAVWGGYCGEIPKNKDIRHATDAEIKAGKRLEVE